MGSILGIDARSVRDLKAAHDLAEGDVDEPQRALTCRME